VAGGSAAVLLSACAGASGTGKEFVVTGSATVEIREDDITILNGVLDVENAAIAAYEAGIPLLAGHPRAAATWFLDQELQHAAKLAATIRGAGGKPNPPKARYDLGNPRDGAEVLELLHTTESGLVNAYLVAIPKVMPGWLRAVAAGILANESQHISILQAFQGRTPVPSAYVTADE
jgi:hypothetical protein